MFTFNVLSLRKIKNERGALTITELLVTLALFSIVIAAGLAFLIEGTSIFNFSEKQVDVQRKTRTALIWVVKDIKGCQEIKEISDDSYALTIHGISAKQEKLEKISTSPPTYKTKYAPLPEEAPPILHDNNGSVSRNNYNVNYRTGELTFDGSPPSGSVTIDYTYNATIEYRLTGDEEGENPNDADLVRTISLSTNPPTITKQTILRHIRNRTDNTPLFTSENRRIKISLVVDEHLQQIPLAYRTQTEVTSSAKVTLVGKWGFEDAADHTDSMSEDDKKIVKDSSLFHNDGTLYQLDWDGYAWSTTAIVGQYSFRSPASNNWVSVQDDDSLDVRKLTITAWLRPDSDHTWGIVDKQGAYKFRIRSDRTLEGKVATEAGQGVKASTNIVPGAWTHVAMTYNGARIRLFINGEEVTYQAGGYDTIGSIQPTDSELRIGEGNADCHIFIDNVCLWNGVLIQYL